MNNRFDKIVFFENEYERELKVKDNINNNFTNILTMLTINMTIFSYLLINIPLFDFFKSEYKIAFIIIYLFGWVYIVYFINVLIHFYNYYFVNDLYMKIPYADKLNEYFQSLEEYDLKAKDKYINKYLLDFYVRASTQNSKVNEYRSDLQYKIRRLLFYKFIVLIIIFIGYYVIMNGDLNTYNIRIKG